MARPNDRVLEDEFTSQAYVAFDAGIGFDNPTAPHWHQAKRRQTANCPKSSTMIQPNADTASQSPVPPSAERVSLRACITAGRRNSWKLASVVCPAVKGTVAPVGPRKPRNARHATSPEVKELRSDALALKECVADLTLENRLLKKSMTGAGEDEA